MSVPDLMETIQDRYGNSYAVRPRNLDALQREVTLRLGGVRPALRIIAYFAAQDGELGEESVKRLLEISHEKRP